MDIVRKGAPFREEEINAYEGARSVLESFSLDWYLPSAGKHKGGCFLRLFPVLLTLKQIYRGTPWEHGQLVPVFTEGVSKGEISPLGVVYTNTKQGGSSRISVLIPEVLIFLDEAGEDEEEEGEGG